MRRSFHDTDFISDEEGNLIGINLGYDFCAEHEWGIESILNSFAVNSEKFGFDSRKNTQVPPMFAFIDLGDSAILYHDSSVEEIDDAFKKYWKDKLRFLSKDDEIAGAWDKRGFAVRVSSKHKALLKSLFKAFKKKDGVVLLSGKRNPFAGSGLMLLDFSKIPEYLKKDSRDADKKSREQQALYRKLEKESGVFEALEKAGKRFLSLSVRQLDDDGNPSWWLNPYGQGAQYGWYTNEDLLAWARDEGPVTVLKKG